MKPAFAIPLSAVAGAAIGFFIGEIRISPLSETARDSAGQRMDRPELTASKKEASAAGNGDFAALLKTYRELPPAGAEFREHLKRLSVSEIQDLITGLAADLKSEGAVGLRKALGEACRELYRREGVGSLEWASALEESPARRSIFGTLLGAISRDNPELGKPWNDRFVATYGQMWKTTYVREALQGAAERSADDVVKMLALHDGEIRYGFSQFSAFAPDFDFKKLLLEAPSLFGTGDAVRYWAAQDKDAAWNGIKDLIAQKRKSGDRVHIGSLYAGIAATEGSEAAMNWIVPRLGEIPEKLRNEAVAALSLQSGMTPAEMKAMTLRLSGNADKLAFASSTLAAFGDPREADMTIEALSPDLKFTSLNEAARRYSGMIKTIKDGRGKEIIAYFEGRMNHAGMTEEQKSSIRANMGL